MKNHNPEIKGYRLLERIGVGVRSVVYKAEKENDGEPRAIKYVKAAQADDRRYVEHLRNEHETLVRIQLDCAGHDTHPNIVVPEELSFRRRLLKVRAAYMVMEYIPGQTLAARHDYPLRELIGYFIQIGEALAFVHRKGLVHGDVKLDNILVRPDAVAKLIDFGFCCPRHTKLSGVRGTRSYIAPEQVGGGTLTEVTDIYNYGASMYRALTGRPLPLLIPTEGGSQAEFISGIHIKPVPIHQLRPEVPRPLSNIIMECCRRDQADRPGSIETVLTRLRKQPLSS